MCEVDRDIHTNTLAHVPYEVMITPHYRSNSVTDDYWVSEVLLPSAEQACRKLGHR